MNIFLFCLFSIILIAIIYATSSYLRAPVPFTSGFPCIARYFCNLSLTMALPFLLFPLTLAIKVHQAWRDWGSPNLLLTQFHSTLGLTYDPSAPAILNLFLQSQLTKFSFAFLKPFNKLLSESHV